MIKPTKRQIEFVAFWHRFTIERGFPPTFLDACAFFGFRSARSAGCHVRACVSKGLLASPGGWGTSRGTIVTALGRQLVAPTDRPRLSPGAVIAESKCECGLSFFVADQTRCFTCARAA